MRYEKDDLIVYNRVGTQEQITQEKYPHLLETTSTQCSRETYMIHPQYTFSDLTEEEKEIVYQSGLEWNEVYKTLFDDMYEQVMKDFKTLKELGLSSEEGKEIIDRWTN